MGEVLSEDRKVAALGLTLRGDLFVCQHGTQARAPVHRGIRQVDQAEFIDGRGLFLFAKVLVIAAVLSGALIGLQLLDELRNRAGLLLLLIEPRVINLQENPLGPLEKFRVGGFHGAARVVPQAQHPQLAAHVLNIRLSGRARVGTGLDGVLLGRQAEGIVAQGMQHILAQHAVIAGVSIGSDITQGVSHVQARAGRVREHILHIELFLRQLALTGGELAYRIRGIKGAIVFPVLLPGLLDLVRQLRGIAVRSGIALGSHNHTV